MNYLSQLNTGLLLLTSQLFSGRVKQHGSSCSGRTNIGEHFILSCTSATHQQRFRADVFQIPQQRQALFVGGKLKRHPTLNE